MIYWTFRSLFSQPMNLIGAAIGIALALILGLFLDAVFRGEANQILTFVEKSPAEVWVLEKGVANLHMSRSTISQQAVNELEKIDGVKTIMPILYRDILLGPKGEELFAYAAGIPSDITTRQSWEQATGWSAPKAGFITIPKPMSKGNKYQIGDKISLSGVNYIISGYSKGTFSMANPLVFIDENDARKQFALNQGANLVLIQPQAGISAEQLVNNIEQQGLDVNALTRKQLMKNDYSVALDMGGALIAMMAMIGTIVAGLIVAFTAYSFVSSKIGELAVVKALGAPQIQLLSSAIIQTSLVALFGVILALIAIFPIEAALSAWAPSVAVQFSFITALKLGLATLIAAQLAALIPAFYVQQIDPASAFDA